LHLHFVFLQQGIVMEKPLKLEIIKDLKNHIQAYYPVSELILFGSQARNEETEDSDYDILVILKTAYSWQDEHDIYALCADICLKYGILVDVHIISFAELKTIRGYQPIYANAVKSGIYA